MCHGVALAARPLDAAQTGVSAGLIPLIRTAPPRRARAAAQALRRHDACDHAMPLAPTVDVGARGTNVTGFPTCDVQDFRQQVRNGRHLVFF